MGWWKKVKKEVKRGYDNYRGTALGTLGMGIPGTFLGGMMDYEQHEAEKLADQQEAALRVYEQAAERERTKTTITDANSAGGSEEQRKKRKRSLLAGAGKEGGSGTLLRGGASGGKDKLGE